MGLFTKWKIKKEIQKAKEEAKANPTPKTTANLADKLMEFGEYDSALSVLETGTKMFPDSDLLQTKFKKLQKLRYQDQIRTLKKEIDDGQSAVAYAKLADIYLKIGEEDNAIETSLEGSEKFPDYEGNFLLLGKLRWERFRRNFLVKDGVKAVEHMETAVKINPTNYRTLFQLARIYVELGAPKHATEKVEAISRVAPNDPNSAKLMQRIQSLPEVSETVLEELFDRLKKSRPAPPPTTSRVANSVAQRLIGNPQGLSQKLSPFYQEDGFVALQVFKEDMNILLSHVANTQKKEAIENNVSKVVKATRQCSLRMDIGDVQDTKFQGPDGWVYVKSFVNILFVFIFNKQAKSRQVDTLFADFFEFGIYQ